MKVTDLMVGDWIQVKRGFNGHLTNEKIKGIIDDDTESYPITLATEETVSLNDVVPIELTEEILVKNGFVKTWNGDWQLKEYSTIIISKDYYVKIFERSIRIDYVHELQHLLRMCGIEKEIEL